VVVRVVVVFRVVVVVRVVLVSAQDSDGTKRLRHPADAVALHFDVEMLAECVGDGDRRARAVPNRIHVVVHCRRLMLFFPFQDHFGVPKIYPVSHVCITCRHAAFHKPSKQNVEQN
jgi:hypothetical protein